MANFGFDGRMTPEASNGGYGPCRFMGQGSSSHPPADGISLRFSGQFSTAHAMFGTGLCREELKHSRPTGSKSACGAATGKVSVHWMFAPSAMLKGP